MADILSKVFKSSRMSEFLSEVKTNGLAKNHKFEVRLAVPTVVREMGDKNIVNKIASSIGVPTKIMNFVNGAKEFLMLRRLRLYCDTVLIPGINISTVPSRTYGEIREMPYEVLYEPVTMSFYVDSALDVKNFFDVWIHNIQHPESRNMRYFEEYAVDIEIDIQNKQDNTIYNVVLYEAYPKAVSGIMMDSNVHDLLKVNVTFVYKYQRVKQKQPVGGLFSVDSDILPTEYVRNFKSFQGAFNSKPEKMNAQTGGGRPLSSTPDEMTNNERQNA